MDRDSRGLVLNHTQIIFNIANVLQYKSYLELGLYQGETINLMHTIVPKCVGVDINNVNITGDFFLGTTDDFFLTNKETFDIIFIDADHRFESAMKDFNNAVKVLNKYGTIFIHDTDPISEKYTDYGYCGDSYKLLDVIGDEYNHVTLPVLEAGLTIVNRKEDKRVNKYL